MKGREIYYLMVLVLGFAGSAMGGGPVAVSPVGEGSIAVISQECPTFSWSQVEGVVSYRLRVFEKVGGIVGSYEAMEKMGGPVVSVEIKAPALSWTPSGEQCLVSGERYVWYVGAVGSDGVERWSEGRGFEVEVGISLGLREALKETVNEYLTKEWISTASYKEVKESITSQVVKEVKGVGVGGVAASQTPPSKEVVEGVTNTFLGAAAGSSISGIYYYDTFIGSSAGFSNTTGSQNSFLGFEAGFHNTTGSYNSFVGAGAGHINTTGYDNSFLGYQAGFSNTTGYDNSFLGYQAGFSNTTGYNNSFLGHQAGYSNTTGYDNSFVGYKAGYANTTGYFNTFLGWSAGESNNTGFCNTFVGFFTGEANTTGHENTFVGYHTGIDNTTGSHNTFLGYQGGFRNIEGSGNVFLGYKAGYNEIGSNKLYIDNSDTAAPLIYGEFDNNLVVINGILSIASSREYKENIDQLRTEEAMETLQNLKPVKFSYKATPSERHAGFISEEVPESLTSRDRKAVSPMDIVAVLTKVVQEQQRVMEKQESIVREQQESLKELKTRNDLLEQRLLALEGKTMAGE